MKRSKTLRQVWYCLAFFFALYCVLGPLPYALAIHSNNVSGWKNASFPLRGGDYQGQTSSFGPRVNPVTGIPSFHWGLDLAAPERKQVLAWWSGTVVKAKQNARGCGNEVMVVAVGGKWKYRYCHLHTIAVKVGEKVVVGQKVGSVGSTGNSTGPHLHWELYLNGIIRDPAVVVKAMREAHKNDDLH